jgi:hypothetical protein
LLPLQAGQVDAVHAPSAFVVALAALWSDVSQCSLDVVMNCRPATIPKLLEGNSPFTPLEVKEVESELKTGVALLVQGTLEGVGPWSVRPSDYCEICPSEHKGVSSSVAISDVETPCRLGNYSQTESERLEVRPRNSFVLVPEDSMAQVTRLNSDASLKIPAVKVVPAPVLQPMMRRSSISLPPLFSNSDDNEPVDLLFGETLVQPSVRKNWIEARLFVA